MGFIAGVGLVGVAFAIGLVLNKLEFGEAMDPNFKNKVVRGSRRLKRLVQ